MSQFINVCKTSDIPVGHGRMFFVQERRLGIFNVDGQMYAMDDCCPHAGASLSHGIIEDNVVRCRIHHWRFCIKNGTYLDQAKPNLDVATYRVRIEGEQVQVELE